MTFNEREQSYNDGEPLLLYDFIRGTTHWRYVSGDRPHVHQGHTYEVVPGGITASPITENGETPQLTRTVTIPQSLPVAANWWPVVVREEISLIILAKHMGDADAEVEWLGRVVAGPHKNRTIQLKCQPERTASLRRGKNRPWQTECPLLLYSTGRGQCQVDRNLHAVTGAVDSLSGIALQSSAFLSVPNGRMAGGYVEYDMPGGFKERRDIDSHNGATVVLDSPPIGLPLHASFVAYPGCGGDWASCAYYQNTPNYGGQIYTPTRSPFDGMPVF